MTATEHAVEVETPLGGTDSQPKLVQKDPQARQQRQKMVYEKADGACTSSRKMIILSHRKAKAEPDGIFRQKPLAGYVFHKSICEVVATSMVSFRPREYGEVG
jgi:hypothetical protein